MDASGSSAMSATRILSIALALAGPAAAVAEPEPEPDGEALYRQHCLVCHQADGWGVPNMQPELWNSPRANGDADAMILFLLTGSASLPPSERRADNDMPGFDYLRDEELAAVISYVRTHFDNDGGPVSVSDVRAARR